MKKNYFILLYAALVFAGCSHADKPEKPITAADIKSYIAVLADDTDRSSVKRGENSGRTLTHVAVARSLTQVARLKGAATESTVQIPLPPLYQKTQMHHLILIAQTTGAGPVVGADTKSF